MNPKVIKKPWGWEEIWADVPGKYLGKTILKKTLNELDKSIHNEI